MTYDELDINVRSLSEDDYLKVVDLVNGLRANKGICSEPEAMFVSDRKRVSTPYSRYQDFQKMFADVFDDPVEMDSINHLYDEL